MVAPKGDQRETAMLNGDANQDRPDEFDNRLVDASACDRLASFDEALAISHDAMRARYANRD